MSLVKGQQSPRPASPGDDDGAEVGQPGVNILISTLEGHDQPVILGFEAGDGEPSRCEVVQERQPCSAAEPAAKQIVDFSGDGGWNHQFPRLLAQEGLHPRLHWIASIGHRDEGPGIDDQCHEPKPSRSSSSGMSATEPPGPSPLPTTAKFRSPRRSGSYVRIARRITSACDVPSRAANAATRAASSFVRYTLVLFMAHRVPHRVPYILSGPSRVGGRSAARLVEENRSRSKSHGYMVKILPPKPYYRL